MKKLALVLPLLFYFPAHAQTFSSSLQVSIPDAGPAVSSPLIVSGLPNTIDTAFGLVGVCFSIDHTWDADLVIKLQAPDGDVIILAGGVGGNADNFTNTCVNMTPGNTNITSGTAPFTGIYFPQESLNGLNDGQDPNGTWYFTVQDNAANDTGHIVFCSIQFGLHPAQNPPPPPILCPACQCPVPGEDCDLLPDMTASGLIIKQSLVETPGIINFSNATPNIGWGPMEIHGVDSCYCSGVLVPCTTICPGGAIIKQRIHQRIYHKRNGNDTLTYYEHSANLMSYHPAHGHIHVDNWANFTLRKHTSNPDARTWPIIGTGTKQSFCLINLGDCTNNHGYCVRANGDTLTNDSIPNAGVGYVTGCGLDQGIYTGNLDIYSVGLNTGIDLSQVCNGDYYIVSVTDIENNFLEVDKNNNWTAVPVTLTMQNPPDTVNSCTFDAYTSGNTVHFYNTTPGVTGPFFWDFGDGSTDSTEHPVHTYAGTGTYLVQMMLLTQCRGDADQAVVINEITGNKEIAENFPSTMKLEVIPNPFNDKLNVNFFAARNTAVNIDLVDMLGRKIVSLPGRQILSGKQQIELDLSGKNIKPGIYVLQLRDEQHSLYQRIMKAE